MLIIGLTGPSGAGKGTVASLFARYGVPSLDTDAIYHELLRPPSLCLDELVARFGPSVKSTAGTLNRQALAALVFAEGHEADLADLNRITHRHVLQEVRRRLSALDALGCPAALVDAPQLFEAHFDTECDRILSVLAPHDLRLARIMARDGLTETQAKARIRSQKSDDEFRKRSDAVLVNDGAIETMDASVRHLLSEWGICHAT